MEEANYSVSLAVAVVEKRKQKCFAVHFQANFRNQYLQHVEAAKPGKTPSVEIDY